MEEVREVEEWVGAGLVEGGDREIQLVQVGEVKAVEVSVEGD